MRILVANKGTRYMRMLFLVPLLVVMMMMIAMTIKRIMMIFSMQMIIPITVKCFKFLFNPFSTFKCTSSQASITFVNDFTKALICLSRLMRT